MKVWFTRPSSDEIFMGGLRSVNVWVDKPMFVHSASKPEFELFETETQEYKATIYRELGWCSDAGDVKAKPFLKQNKDIMARVWSAIYESTLPLGCTDPKRMAMDFGECQDMLDFDYELRCRTHWKRFLLELDLSSGDLKVVVPRVIWTSGVEIDSMTVPMDAALTCLFYDEDLHRPFYYHISIPYEHSTENIW